MYPRNGEQLLKGKDSSLEVIRKNMAKKKNKETSNEQTNKQTKKQNNNYNNSSDKNKNGFNFRLSFFF